MRMSSRRSTNAVTISGGLSLTSIGFVVWLVFLILKLCNQNNPDYQWLTWFWVWFPFWLPWAIEGAVLLIAFLVSIIVYKIER